METLPATLETYTIIRGQPTRCLLAIASPPSDIAVDRHVVRHPSPGSLGCDLTATHAHRRLPAAWRYEAFPPLRVLVRALPSAMRTVSANGLARKFQCELEGRKRARRR